MWITADIQTQRKSGVADDSFEVILDYNHLKVTLKSGMLVTEQQTEAFNRVFSLTLSKLLTLVVTD
jgi:hypothetical protein